MTDLRKTFDTLHPHHSAMTYRWSRWRAFGEGIEDDAAKKAWLPRGQGESDDAYNARIALTQDLGTSPSAATRVCGALMRGAVVRDYAASKFGDRLKQFDQHAGGVGVTVEKVLERGLAEAARMGLALYFVGRTPTPGAVNAAQEALPFVEPWKVEELLDWDEEPETGVLRWVVLRRTVSRRVGPLEDRADRTTWLVLDPLYVRRYEAEPQGVPVATGEYAHGLGVVPLVAHYWKRTGVLRGQSYIAALARADHRRLALESDLAASAALHGSPRLKLKTNKEWDKVFAGPSKALFLNAEDKEDAEYLELDPSGMDIMSRMTEAGDRRGAELAGMDPATFGPVGSSGATAARSGAAMQWAFSTAEAPTLEDGYEGLHAADVGLHEMVARYLSQGADPPDVTVFDGQISREKKWDFLALEDLVEMLSVAKDDVKSETWRREVAKQLAVRVPGNLPPELQAKILREIDAADYSETPPETDRDPLGGATQPPRRAPVAAPA